MSNMALEGQRPHCGPAAKKKQEAQPSLAAMEAVRSRLFSGCFAPLNVTGVVSLSRKGKMAMRRQVGGPRDKLNS